jgi:putative chitinase
MSASTQNGQGMGGPSLEPVARPALEAQPSPIERPGILLTPDTFKRFAPRAKPELVSIVAGRGNDVLARFGINANAGRLCHFLAQVSHECAGFTVLEENLNYSAARMVQVFGPGKHSARITEAEAAGLAGNKVSFAERIYGLGNPAMARRLGNTEPGDGYRYRGRGFMQITGRANYREMGNKIGVDLEADPDLAAQPLYALMTAAAFWDNCGLNPYADRDDLEGITKRINGGLNGLDHRKSNLASARSIFSQGAAAPADAGPPLVPRGVGSPAPGRSREDEPQQVPDWIPSAFGGSVAAFAAGPSTGVVPFRGPKAGSGLQGGSGPALTRMSHQLRAVRDHGRLVLAFGFMFLLAAFTIPAGRYLLEPSIIPGTPWEALVLGFTALVGIASLGFIVLGWKIASVRMDASVSASARTGARDIEPRIHADAA